MKDTSGLSTTLTIIAGSVIQVVSGINFFLYAKAAKQFSSFHDCLERMNRFLLANTLCDNISCKIKMDDTRVELIKIMANAPLIHAALKNRKTKNKDKVKVKTVYPEETIFNSMKNGNAHLV